MIAVQDLTKVYQRTAKQMKEAGSTEKSVYAVDHISFQCKPGKVFSLLGPNGAGKTTTLRMIATLLVPTSGHISVGGHDVATQSQEVRRQLGFLTGSTQLYDRLTASEVVKYFADLYQLDDVSFKRKKDELFTLLGIHDFKDKRIGHMSTGMKQKVSIARTMIHDPSVVVFDEPTSGLDVISAASIIDLIHRCRAEGKTVLFSSHIMSEVDLLCDELAIINKGKLVFEGSLDQFKALSEGQSLTQTFIQVVTQNN